MKPKQQQQCLRCVSGVWRRVVGTYSSLMCSRAIRSWVLVRSSAVIRSSCAWMSASFSDMSSVIFFCSFLNCSCNLKWNVCISINIFFSHKIKHFNHLTSIGSVLQIYWSHASTLQAPIAYNLALNIMPIMPKVFSSA